MILHHVYHAAKYHDIPYYHDIIMILDTSDFCTISKLISPLMLLVFLHAYLILHE